MTCMACNSLDGLEFKNKKYTKYEKKKAFVRISKSDANKNKLFYICDDMSCDNTFSDWCKSIKDIELATRLRKGASDIDQILDGVKTLKMNHVKFESWIIMLRLAMQV